MFFVRIVSLVILSSCIGNQASAMFARGAKPMGRVPSVGRVGKPHARSLCTRRPAIQESNVGATLVIGTTCAIVVKYWVDTKEAERLKAAREESAFELGLHGDTSEGLNAFIDRAIEHGINPNHIVAAGGMTALMKAGSCGDQAIFEKLLKLGGYDINAKDLAGRPVLWWCTHYSMIKVLLACDELDIDHDYGHRFCADAIRRSDPEFVTMLVERGWIDFSDSKTMTSILITAIVWHKRHNEYFPPSDDPQLKVLPYLLSQPGIKISNDVFDIAVRTGNQNVINLFLVHAGAKDPNTCGFYYEGDEPKGCMFYCKDELSGRLHKLNMNPANPSNE